MIAIEQHMQRDITKGKCISFKGFNFTEDYLLWYMSKHYYKTHEKYEKCFEIKY